MATEEIVHVSRFLSKVLRHDPGILGLELDTEGWVDIGLLLKAIERSAKAPEASKRVRSLPLIDRQLLERVVAESDKKRFAISQDRSCIRAVQGHSVKVDLGYASKEPPEVLFHGTAAVSLPAIEREGLLPRARHAVHLSSTPKSAREVGSRHGRPVVLTVLAARMHRDGYRFSQADNGVWLTDRVPPQYLRLA